MEAGANLGRYQLLAEIGRGAMGTVYQALDPEIDRLVAIKTFSALDGTSQEGAAFRERFAQEARAAGRLTHPGIVAIYDCGEEPSSQTPYIVMEYIAGQPLSRLLIASNARLEERYALRLTEEIAEALHYAHEKGVVHRDIKPANILITEEGNAKIADFGVARIDTSEMTMHGQLLGTPAFMSPEQLTGGAVDGRSDIFSLGVILYTMLMGFRPFQGDGASTIGFKVINQHPLPITSFHLDLSRDTEYVVARAMAKNPADRYQTSMAMARDLEDILAERTPRSRTEIKSPVSSEIFRVMDPGTAAMSGTPRVPSAHVLPRAQVAAPARSSVALRKPDAEPTPSRRRWLAMMLTLAVLAAGGISALAALYLNDTQAAALRREDSKLPLPGGIPERLPVAAVAGGIEEPVFSVDLPGSTAASPSKAKKEPASDLDATVVHHQGPPANPTGVATADAAANPPAWKDPLLERQPAALELAFEHHFLEAQIEVWVDNKLEFSGTTHGESKKHLLVLKGGVQGRESHEIRFAGGEHDVKVRIHSQADQYDQTGSIRSTFLESRRAVLDVRCNKRGIELKLSDGS